MKKTLVILLCLGLCGCTYSIPETYLRDKRPETLKIYKGWPISKLSDSDIQEAVNLGKVNKHNQDVINYAFLLKKHGTSDDGIIYIFALTNYYLIADYVAKQEREYGQLDQSYIKFLANLPTFRLLVFTYPYYQNKKFVLLKDGVKLEPSSENPLFNNNDPYSAATTPFLDLYGQKAINDVIKQSIELANKVTESYGQKMPVNTAINVIKPDNLYDYVTINPFSKYEIAILYLSKEVRLEVDFSSIK
jgi:hypothetical protein